MYKKSRLNRKTALRVIKPSHHESSPVSRLFASRRPIDRIHEVSSSKNALVCAYLLSGNDVLESLLANVGVNRPSREDVSRLEHFLHLFNGATFGLWEHKHDLDEGGKVEGGEEEIGLVGNVRKCWGNSPCQCRVECPVGCC